MLASYMCRRYFHGKLCTLTVKHSAAISVLKSLVATRCATSIALQSEILPQLSGSDFKQLESRSYCSKFSAIDFEHISEETLESLCEKFEELNELPSCPADFDVTYSAGVLTVVIGAGHGTYVINKQAPNMQIWLSSPITGPKRYNYINNGWVYKHENSLLHQLLSRELSAVFGEDADFMKCSYSGF